MEKAGNIFIIECIYIIENFESQYWNAEQEIKK